MTTMPIIGSSMTEIDEEEETVFRNLLPIIRSNNNFLYRMCHIMNLLEVLREPKSQLSLMTMRFMLAKKLK
jgi:hypothetical protein